MWQLVVTDNCVVWRRTIGGKVEERPATAEEIADAMDDLYDQLGHEEFGRIFERLRAKRDTP